MVNRKITAIAFKSILIIAWLVVFGIQVEAQTTDEQKQTLIGEWNGDWAMIGSSPATLIIHEIDTANAKVRCTYISSMWGDKKFPILADFIPGPNPKLEFKLEGNDLKFVLKNKVLEATFRGTPPGERSMSKTIKMEKRPKK